MTITFTKDEVSLALSLVATLDPDSYVYDETKAVILKCKHSLDSGSSIWISR